MPNFGAGHISFQPQAAYFAVADSAAGPLHIFASPTRFVDIDGWTTGLWTGVFAVDVLNAFSAAASAFCQISWPVGHVYNTGNAPFDQTVITAAGELPPPGWWQGATDAGWSVYGANGAGPIEGEFGTGTLLVLTGAPGKVTLADVARKLITPPAPFPTFPFPDLLDLACPATQPVVNTAYAAQLVPIGGTAPYVFTLTAGPLPTGITLSSSGLLSGTPTVLGTFPYTVQVIDASGFTGTAICAVIVGGTPPPAACPAPAWSDPGTTRPSADPSPVIP